MLRFVVITSILLVEFVPAFAHDHWINGKRNSAGEQCCGENDCFVVDVETAYKADSAGTMQFGYLIRNELIEVDKWEFVPEHEAMKSPDGAYWRCRRPDGMRRCFFAPVPSN